MRRLYEAICLYWENKAIAALNQDDKEDFGPGGDVFTATEAIGQHSPDEMNSNYRPDSYGVISLKWHPGTPAKEETK